MQKRQKYINKTLRYDRNVEYEKKIIYFFHFKKDHKTFDENITSNLIFLSNIISLEKFPILMYLTVAK